jgi:hypothetical protein
MVGRRAWATLVLVAALVAAGCGGSSGSDSVTSTTGNTPQIRGQSYATSVCSIAHGWSAVSDEIDTYLAGNASGQDVLDQASNAQALTSTYIDNIRGLPQPDDASQKAAYDSLQATANKVFNRTQTIQKNLDSIETGAKPAQKQIELLYGDLKTSVTQLDGIYPTTGVADAVASHPNCEELQT